MEITRKRATIAIVVVVVVIAALIALYVAYERWSPYDETDLERWIENLGPWGPIIYILVFAGSMLFAPLPTAPLPVLAATAFGGALGFGYTMAATAIGSVICYALARKLGRPALRRLMSQAALDKVDELGERLGIRLLIVLRLFPVAGVDYVSYAAGLTKMRFLPYFAISVLASAPVLGLAAVLGEGVRRNWVIALAALAAIVVFFAIPIGWVAWRRSRERRQAETNAVSVGAGPGPNEAEGS